MKIGPPIDTAAPSASGAGRTPGAAAIRTQAAARRAEGEGESEGAKVHLSDTAATLKSTAASPEFNAEKVQAIRQSIEDGTFRVDAHLIAERLIGNARELLGRFSH
ncbi:flagellar biosynthesis anti-sigma factor FlgM [Caldimonas tepidiphila]|uniref:flagellar biosynthesis anti-sigma factor FlgM n=1 Tax=Caldimonas tepidiphila TaxID=2315841 RepID=UPI00130027DC|nr:flagellar biosynthesis anti-sigma factor FlgM [Caldimonas tepidiphila]